MKSISLRTRDGGDGGRGSSSSEGGVGATTFTPNPNFNPTPNPIQNLMLVLEIYSKSGRRSSLHRTNARDLLFHIHAKSNGSSEGANNEDKSSLLLIAADSMAADALVIDKEINFFAALIRMSRTI